MTQRYSPGVGSKNIPTATQIPTANTYDTVETSLNRMTDRSVDITFDQIVNTSGDSILTFAAPANGIIKAITLNNGAVACDGSNGLELSFINKSNSDDVLGYFGYGSGTEAAKATDTDVAVAANEVATIANSDTSRFNKGDKIQCTIDRDGTTVVGQIVLHLSLEPEGR